MGLWIVTFNIDIFCDVLSLSSLSVSLSPSPDMLEMREGVVSRLQELEEQIEPIVELFEDTEVAEHMKRCGWRVKITISLTLSICREDQSLFDYLAQNHQVNGWAGHWLLIYNLSYSQFMINFLFFFSASSLRLTLIWFMIMQRSSMIVVTILKQPNICTSTE